MEYKDLADLREGTIVLDADGRSWHVGHHGDEVWLSPFSDEYSVWFNRDGSPVAVKAELPPLPLTNTGIITTGGV